MIINILAILAAVIVALLVIALFVKKEYAIERSIIINRPDREVFDYVRQLKNQDHYSKWVMADPGMEKKFTGTDGTVGFIYAWNSDNKAGEGEQEITGIAQGRRVDIEIRFVRPFKATAGTPFTIEPVTDSQTKVTWGMSGRYNYPMNLMNLFIGSILGKDMDTSLMSLKHILEKTP